MYTLVKQKIEKSVKKIVALGNDPNKIQIKSSRSSRLNLNTNLIQIYLKIQSLRWNFQSY